MIFCLLACQPTQLEASLSDSAEPNDPVEVSTDEENLIISSMLYLNRSGRLFVYDRSSQEEVWSLSNPDDPVWLDAHLSPDGEDLYHNVVDVRNHNPALSEIRRIDFDGNTYSSYVTFFFDGRSRFVHHFYSTT